MNGSSGATGPGVWRGYARPTAGLLRAALVLVIVVVGAGRVTAAPDSRPFSWPLRPRPTVTRAFDPPEQVWSAGHRGVDLAGAPGHTVYAAGPGVVVFAGEVAGRPVISIRHEGDVRTTYEPVRARVAVGDRVGRGTAIGALEAGHPGCPAGCLHWGARRERSGRAKPEYLDPLRLLRPTPIRLEPVRPTP